MQRLVIVVVVMVGIVASTAPSPSYGYDGSAQVIAAAHDVGRVADTTTTVTVNTRTIASSERSTPRAEPTVLSLADGEGEAALAAKGARGGIGPVRVGQAGEDAVRGAYSIGDKVPITVNGRGRIPDGLTPTTLSEVKNVASLSYSRQLRNFADYAQQTGRQFDLYVRPGTTLTGPLQDAAGPGGPINLKFIP